MKPAGFHLLPFVVFGTLAAQEPAPAPAPRVSGRLKDEIRASLPAYTPPPPTLLDQPKSDGAESDPDLYALPKFTVKEKRLQRIESNDLLTPKALNRKFAADYKRSLKGLDALLNGFSIPLISPSFASRGRAAYEERQNADIRHVIEAGRMADPKNSALANEKTDLQEALDRQDRPAGDGRKK